MLICSRCNKTFRQESKYCPNCGTPLVNSSEAAGEELNQTINTVQPMEYGVLQPTQQGSSEHSRSAAQPPADFSVHHETAENPAGYSPVSTPQASATTEKKTGAGAIAGMFIVNCIPILGFPAAFLWAQAKMKRAKIKLVAVSAVFLILNISITVVAYAFSINLMKNRLAKAVESTMVTGHPKVGNQKLPSSQNPDPSAQTSFPGIGDSIPMQDIPGLDSGMLEQLVPGFSGLQGEAGYDPGEYQIPEGISMPEIDEDGNMHVDADGDGVVDMILDNEGNILSSTTQIPSVDSNGNVFIDQDGDGENDILIDPSGNITQDGDTKLPEMGEDGNMYLDTDGDGEYDSYMIESGHIVPMGDRTRIDEKGNRYIDYDGDGTFETMIEPEGTEHYDMDGDGKYETSFEGSWGEG